jgi:hypothetical protein
MVNKEPSHATVRLKCNIDDEPGDTEEPVKLNELYELVGLVVVEMNRFHAHPQVGCLRLNYSCKNCTFTWL